MLQNFNQQQVLIVMNLFMLPNILNFNVYLFYMILTFAECKIFSQQNEQLVTCYSQSGVVSDLSYAGQLFSSHRHGS